MRNIVLTFALLLAMSVVSQEQRENAILPGCEQTEEPESCLRKKLQQDIMSLFSESVKQTLITGMEKDFFTIPIAFISDEMGKIDPASIVVNSPLEALSRQIKTHIVKLPDFLPKINKKGKGVKTAHLISPRYKIDRERKEILIPTALELKEVGKDAVDLGTPIVFNVPGFPGCKRIKNRDEKITCFQQKMQEHIRMHFKYPKKAQKLGLEGKVFVMFIINEEGAVSKIRTRGPHKILEAEALRIIKKLPKMTPGKYRSVSIGVPFAIPITFKLS